MKLSHFRAAVVSIVAATTVTLTQIPEVEAVVPPPFDSTFGVDGIATHVLPLQKSQSSASDILQDSSGNLFVLLTASTGAASGESVTVSKFSGGGSAISTYGTNGQSEELLLDQAVFAIQTDGKIIVSGSRFSNYQTKIIVYRLNVNGRIDTTFGTNGEYSTSLNPGSMLDPNRLLLAFDQSNNRIHLGLSISNHIGNNNNFFFFALDLDGIVDSTWGFSGSMLVTPQASGTNAWAQLLSMQLLSDGSLLGIGRADTGLGQHGIVLTKFGLSGYLDQTFDGASNGNGVVIVPFANEYWAEMGASVVLQDDSVVLAGIVKNNYWAAPYYGMTKILANGIVDTSFGSNGFSLSPLQSQSNVPDFSRLGIQTDGRYVFPINSGTTAGFMRVEANGTFSSSPNCSQCFWSGANDGALANSLVVQPDNKIVVSGSLRISQDAIVRRFDATGVADGTFVSTTLQKYKEQWTSRISFIRTSADGNILGFGSASVVRHDQVINRVLVMKFKPTGALNTEFGLGGFQMLAPPNDQYSMNLVDAHVLSDGKILILGSGRENQDTNLLMWRLNGDGSSDSSFGVNGMSVTSEANVSFGPSSLIVTASGKVMIPLNKDNGSLRTVWIYQYTANGTLDSSFTDSQNVPGGKKPSIGDGSGNSYPSMATAAEDGKYFVAGITVINSARHTFLAKFLSDGTLDPTFSSGYITWDVQQSHSLDYITNVTIGNTGKVFVLGYVINPTESALLIQLNPDGTRINTFNGIGYVTLDFRNPAQIDFSYPIDVVLKDNVFTILGGGDSNPSQNQSTNFSSVARLTTSGALDPSFGSGGMVEPIPLMESTFNDIAELPDGSFLIAGMVGTGVEKIALMKIGQAIPTPSTPPSTNTPTATTPSTTISPVTPTTSEAPAITTPPSTTVDAKAIDELKLVISVGQKTLLKRLNVSVPVGAKVAMSTRTPKICRVAKSKVLATSTGICKVSITVTHKLKKTTKTLVLKVT